MKRITIGITLCLVAAGTGLSAYAGDHRKESRDRRHKTYGMQELAVVTRPGEPAHGWRYFADARGGRAVVISPNGDYYYSHGDGLDLVFKASSAD